MVELRSFRASDGYRFYVRHYVHAVTPRGRMLMFHGIRSHGGWYERSCRAFAEAGYEVHFLDRRGAGLNTARRGDSPSFRRLLDDAVEYAQLVRESQNGLPLFAAGISWGGKLALGLPIRKPGIVDGIALLAPGLCPVVRPPLSQRLRIPLAGLIQPTKSFPIPLNDPELFTADEHWREFINTERHGLLQASARFLFESFRFDIYLKRKAAAIRSPILLILAGRDRILNNAETRAYAARWVKAKSIAIVDYPGSQHTLEFENESHPFSRDLVAWMERVREAKLSRRSRAG